VGWILLSIRISSGGTGIEASYCKEILQMWCPNWERELVGAELVEALIEASIFWRRGNKLTSRTL